MNIPALTPMLFLMEESYKIAVIGTLSSTKALSRREIPWESALKAPERSL